MIEPHADVRLYFRERLQKALREHEVRTAEHTEFYLVNLLASFALSPDEELLAKPLAHLLAEALSTESYAERLQRFRDLGDGALYICGFFADHLEHRRIPRDYVVSMGGRAYEQAVTLVDRSDVPQLADVYGELAERFDAFARVIYDVREMTALRTPQDIIRMYERWRKTRSPKLANRLAEEGVFPVEEKDETVH